MRPLAAAFLAFGLLLPTAIAADPVRIVAFGDSNTAGFGVSAPHKYPSQLERALKARGHDVEVVNAGVSGETTRGGLRRVDAAIPEGTDIAIVFLGRNDYRFGVTAAGTRRNLDEIVGRLRARGIEVILAGFYPYDFSEIAAANGADYYPEFFDGIDVNGRRKPGYTLFWDVIGHLNARGYEEVVARLAPAVESQVVKVFCRRLAEAIMFAPQCMSEDAWAEVTGSLPVRR
jgi:acyl-CoA thioesterase-1